MSFLKTIFMVKNGLLTFRTILLTLVMVLAVVTVAAPASAQTISVDRSISSTTINTNDSTTVTVTVQTDGSGNGFTIDDTFAGPVDTVSSTIVDDAGGTITSHIADNFAATVVVDNPNPNSQFVFEYTINSKDNTTMSGSTGTITISDGAGSTVSMGTDTITVDAPAGNVPPTAVYSDPNGIPAQYDTNKDGKISQAELAAGTQDYFAGNINQPELVDLLIAYSKSS